MKQTLGELCECTAFSMYLVCSSACVYTDIIPYTRGHFNQEARQRAGGAAAWMDGLLHRIETSPHGLLLWDINVTSVYTQEGRCCCLVVNCVVAVDVFAATVAVAVVAIAGPFAADAGTVTRFDCPPTTELQ